MKKNIVILGCILSIILTIVCTLTTTYAVIINVTQKDGKDEIINTITIKDLLINENGTFNNYYYNVKKELYITDDECKILMDSNPLNNSLQTVLKSVVDVKLHRKQKIDNDTLYNFIVLAVKEDDNIEEYLKEKVINKSKIFIIDISDYIYDIDVNLIEATKWYTYL